MKTLERIHQKLSILKETIQSLSLKEMLDRELDINQEAVWIADESVSMSPEECHILEFQAFTNYRQLTGWLANSFIFECHKN